MGLSREEKMVVFDQELWPHRDAVYNFSFSLTTNEADADDLLQETMQKAFRFIESYQQGTNPKAWLFRICKNNFINDYRKRRSRGITIDIEEQKDFNDSALLIVDMREEIFRNIMHDEVQDAVNSLPVDFRAVLLLCDVEDFSYEEMSKILDIPIGTVRSRLHRARKMLQERLKEYASNLGYTVKK
ncbi:sigma-70 family RNA polymerase sigma factor [Chitinophagales bacterium]|nr:sigma-70 family RNA polymerase sigma factor [Chitinophagales bacterium]